MINFHFYIGFPLTPEASLPDRQALGVRGLYTLLIYILSNSIHSQSDTAHHFFKDITTQSSIHHQFKVYEGMFGGGACAFDLNHDGFEDVYITGGMNDDALYINQKNGTFKNAFNGSGLELTKQYVTQGVAYSDVNRDGWEDLFITTITIRDTVLTIPRAVNLLFINNKNGTFRDATKEYKLDKFISFSTGASFGDINRDGYPDMYIGNYFLDYQGQLSVINDATIVNANQTAKGNLLINHHGKYFTDDYKKWGLSHRGFGFGGVFTDFDNDGDLDLFVNQDFGYKAVPDFLFENLYPKSKFHDVSKEYNMDLKINSMGTAVGDYDNDGDLDYYMTNIRFNQFMVNQGKGKPFINKSKESGLEYFAISWGANFADFDNDGDLDLFVSNGDLNPNCVPMADFYFENDGQGHFIENARKYGINDYGIGRGSIIFDMDNDGDLDLLVVNQEPTCKNYPANSETHLYRNDSAGANWIEIQLKGNASDFNGIGSRINLYAGNQKLIREIDGGSSSHLSQNSSVVHFGLGLIKSIDSIEVKWTSGNVQTILHPDMHQKIILEEKTIQEKSLSTTKYILGLFILILAFAIFLFIKKML